MGGSEITMLIIIGFVILSIIIYKNSKKRKRDKELKELQEREAAASIKRLRLLVSEIHPEILNANHLFSKLTEASSGYFSNYQLVVWKNQFQKTFDRINGKPYAFIQLDSKTLWDIEQFHNFFIKGSNLRDSFNIIFKRTELKNYKTLFDNIEGHPLDEQQRNAVVTDEDNNLIIAGAGTGKTKTIAGKVAYLISRYNVLPSEILLISFTNKSCDVMKERIKKKMKIDVNVKTFNKLGLDIIKEVEDIDQKSVCDLGRNELLEVFNSFFKSLLENKEYLELTTKYFTSFIKPYKDENEFQNEGERIQYLKDQNLKGYKIIKRIGTDGTPYQYREKFKSQEEVEIANYLFLNGIEYEYEEHYEYKTASKKFGQYKPDFYFPQYKIYLEHFAIDKNGNVPKWFKGEDGLTAKEKYNDGIAWKRDLHKEKGTKLIESYSWERRDGILLNNLKEKLEKEGVKLAPKTQQEIWEIIKQSSEDDVNGFVQLLITFLTLLKSNNYNLNDVKNRSLKEENPERRSRNIAFLQIFQPIYEKYNNFLKDRNQIDFSDMISIATNHVSENRFTSSYKYIIIDEFQDISIGRYNLLKSLLDSNPSTKLYCVGDDWQSIYRFTGSDIAIFTQFNTYFETSKLLNFKRVTELMYIETTYRFDKNMIMLTSDFILKNKNQLKKELMSNDFVDQQKIPYTYFYYNFEKINIQIPIVNSLKDIIKKEGLTSKIKILLLGRYSFDINSIKKASEFSIKFEKSESKTKVIYFGAPNLDIEFMTVHSAKGLEADYVILLNVNSGKFGFPSEISDDPILNLLLTESDQFPNGEERRVFYVAMTRTKKHLYIVANEQIKSKFLIEILNQEKNDAINCPWCETGILLEKSGAYGDFYSCNNFPYCNFTQTLDTSDFIEIAERSKKDKDYKTALTYYSKAIKSDRKNQLSFYEQAQCLEKLGEYHDAIESYTESIRLAPNHFSSYYWRASSKYDIKDYEGAIADWTASIKLEPKNASVYYWRGLCYKNLKNFADAVANFSVGIIKDPSNAENYCQRGECYILFNNDRINAWDDWNIAKELGSKNAEALFTIYKLNTKPEDERETTIKESFDEKLLGVKSAIKRGQLIKFKYKKSESFSDGSRSLRTIKPIEITSVGASASICIKGYCYLRKEERTFAIDRITNLTVNPNKIEFGE